MSNFQPDAVPANEPTDPVSEGRAPANEPTDPVREVTAPGSEPCDPAIEVTAPGSEPSDPAVGEPTPVIAATGDLATLSERPLSEHPDVYERIHTALQGALADIDEA